MRPGTCYNPNMIAIDSHPQLDAASFTTRFTGPLGELTTPPSVLDLFADSADAPLTSNDAVRKATRDLLRHGGFKPTGRNKPASEYLIKAVQQNLLSSINVAVDVLNAVSLHSGLPISVIDLSKVTGSLRIAIAPEGSEYVFNPAGHVLKLDGLLCLFDEAGPCANAVKDSQRTKTDDSTRETLSIVWGTHALEGRTQATVDWYQQLLSECGHSTASEF